MRLPIKLKIALASLVSVGLVMALIAFVLSAQTALADLMGEMIEKNMSAMRFAEQIKYDFVLYDDLVFRHLFTEDKVLLAESDRVRGKVHETIRRMKDMARGQTEEELLADIEDETSRYESDVRRLLATYSFSTEDQKRNLMSFIQAVESGAGTTTAPIRQSHRQTLALLSAEGRARLTRIYSQCEKLVDISRAKLEDAQLRVQETVKKTQRAALWAGSAVVAGTLLVAFFMAVSLLLPLKRLLAGVQKITTGDLDLELPVEGADEVGRLTHEFNTMTRYLREKQQRLTNETITDSLTGLRNFRYFQTHLKEEVSRALRYKHVFALLIADIDHFKHFNDTNGHQMGNVILKQVAECLKETLRKEDFIARYGGEEFVVMLPETDKARAHLVAERLRDAVAQSEFPGGQNQPEGRVTVSLGGAVFPADSEIPGRLVEKADKALYASKKGGRNRVTWSE